MAKRFLKTAVVSALFALTLAVSASAASAGGATTTTAVNFRTGAGTNYGIISTLPAGTHVVVSSQSSGGWATVVYNGTVGYISSDYLKRANDMDASFGTGTIDGSYVRMRSGASTSSSILGTYNSGTTMTVTGVSGAWYKVSYNAVEGYMAGEYLTVSTSMDAALGYGKVNSDVSSLNIRSGAGTGCSVLSSVSGGTVLELTGVQDGWYKVVHGGTSGYVSSDYITLTSETPAATVAASSVGEEIAAYAQNFLGTPYVYGGSSTSGFDCSGFTKYVYGQFGYTLNRTATDQLSNGVSVRKDELQPGDLVFFKYRTSKPVSHVGIYIGSGQFVHASTNSYAVQIDDLSSGHYANVYVYGRRVV